MSNPYEDEKLYSESELLQILYGLGHFYHSKPWWTRWYWKPWALCLEILAIQLCGESLILKADQENAVQEIEDLLD